MQCLETSIIISIYYTRCIRQLVHFQAAIIAMQFVLITCFLIHFINVQENWIVEVSKFDVPLVWGVFQGMSFLLYPFCGWLADTYTTNFKMIVISFFAVAAGSLVTLLMAIVNSLFYGNNQNKWNILYVGIPIHHQFNRIGYV